MNTAIAEKLISLTAEQGSDEWRKAREGIPTASQFGRIVKADGSRSSTKTYFYELLAESMQGWTEGFKSKSMQAGNDREESSRQAYEFFTGTSVTEVGGVFLDENKTIMVSPDGLIPELKKGLEMKNPDLKTHLQYCYENILPSEYKAQVMGNLWVTGYDTWDFVSYHPDHENQTLLVITVERDEKYIEKMAKSIKAFSKELELAKAS